MDSKPLGGSPRFTGRAEWTLVRGSPLARGVTFSSFLPLTMAPLVAAAVALSELAGIHHPLAFGAVAVVAAWPLATAWSRRVARREAVDVAVFADRVRFSSRRGELVFPIASTRAALDAREWSSSRTVGHQVWTILVLERDETAFSLGARGRRSPASGRTGMPMHACDRATLEAVARAWDLEVP